MFISLSCYHAFTGHNRRRTAFLVVQNQVFWPLKEARLLFVFENIKIHFDYLYSLRANLIFIEHFYS